MSDPPSWIVDKTEVGAHAESADAVDPCLGCSEKCCCCACARACAGAAARAVKAVTVESSRAIEEKDQQLGPEEAAVLIAICTLMTLKPWLSPLAIDSKVCCASAVEPRARETTWQLKNRGNPGESK